MASARGKGSIFPHFKSRKKGRSSFHLNNDKFDVADHALYVPKLGWVNVAKSLRFEGKRMGAVVSQQAERLVMFEIAVEMELPVPRPFLRATVGADLGIEGTRGIE